MIKKIVACVLFSTQRLVYLISTLSLHKHAKLSDTYLMRPPAMHSPHLELCTSAGYRAEDMRRRGEGEWEYREMRRFFAILAKIRCKEGFNVEIRYRMAIPLPIVMHHQCQGYSKQ